MDSIYPLMNCTPVYGDSPTDQVLKQTEEQKELKQPCPKSCVVPVMKTGDSNKRPLANILNPCEDTRSRIDQAKSDVENGSPMPFKRGRGRPRKADKLLQDIKIKIESSPTSSGDIMKKKRGRPRKDKSNYSRDLSKEIQDIKIKSESGPTSSGDIMKKKRGRPRKDNGNYSRDLSKELQDIKIKSESGPTSWGDMKKKRGRPRKDNGSYSRDLSKELQDIKIKIESGPTSWGDMKKKRGRPRKDNSNYSRDLSKELQDIKIKIESGPTSSGDMKKKRGRPRKDNGSYSRDLSKEFEGVKIEIGTSPNGLESTKRKKRGRPPKTCVSAQSSRNLFEQSNQEKIHLSQNSLNNIDDGSPIEEPNICNEPSKNHEQSSAQPYLVLRPIKNLIEDPGQLLDASSDLPKGFWKPVEVGVLPIKRARGRPKKIKRGRPRKAEIAGSNIMMTHSELTRQATSNKIQNRFRRRLLSLTKPKEEKQENKNTCRKMISSTGSLGIKIDEVFSLSESSNSWLTQMIPEVVVNGNCTEFKEEPESSGEIDEEPEWSEEIGNDSNERTFFDTCTIEPNLTNQPIANGNTSEIDEESEWAEEIVHSFDEGNISDSQIAESNFTNQPIGNSNAPATTVLSNNVNEDSSCTESISGDHYISTLDRNPFSKVLGKEFLKTFALQEQLPSFSLPLEGKDHMGHGAKELYSRIEGTCYEGNPKHCTPVNLPFSQQNNLNTLENPNYFKIDGVRNKNCVNAGEKSLLDVQVKMRAKELYQIARPYFTSLKLSTNTKVTTFDDIINLKFLEMASEIIPKVGH